MIIGESWEGDGPCVTVSVQRMERGGLEEGNSRLH